MHIKYAIAYRCLAPSCAKAMITHMGFHATLSRTGRVSRAARFVNLRNAYSLVPGFDDRFPAMAGPIAVPDPGPGKRHPNRARRGQTRRAEASGRGRSARPAWSVRPARPLAGWRARRSPGWRPGVLRAGGPAFRGLAGRPSGPVSMAFDTPARGLSGPPRPDAGRPGTPVPGRPPSGRSRSGAIRRCDLPLAWMGLCARVGWRGRDCAHLVGRPVITAQPAACTAGGRRSRYPAGGGWPLAAPVLVRSGGQLPAGPASGGCRRRPPGPAAAGARRPAGPVWGRCSPPAGTPRPASVGIMLAGCPSAHSANPVWADVSAPVRQRTTIVKADRFRPAGCGSNANVPRNFYHGVEGVIR